MVSTRETKLDTTRGGKPGKELAHGDTLRRLPLPKVPLVLPRSAENFMLARTLPDVLSTGEVDQATKRDPGLSQVVLTVAR